MTSNFPELDPFAVERSHKASQVANEHSRATAQACILINGGAATAAIAFMSKTDVPAAVLKQIPNCIATYAFGVLFGSFMMFCMTQTMENWSSFWYWKSHGASDQKAGRAATVAAWWWRGYMVCFALSTLSFLLATVLLGRILYR